MITKSSIGNDHVDIHYTEYSSADVLQYPSTSSKTAPDYLQDFLDGTSTLNKVKGQHYDQSGVLGGELPQFYQVINPSDPSYEWKKRTFPGNIVGDQILR